MGDRRSSGTRDLEDVGTVNYAREVIFNDPRFEIIETADTLTVLRGKTDG